MTGASPGAQSRPVSVEIIDVRMVDKGETTILESGALMVVRDSGRLALVLASPGEPWKRWYMPAQNLSELGAWLIACAEKAQAA